MFFGASIITNIGGNSFNIKNNVSVNKLISIDLKLSNIDSLSKNSAYPGETVTIYGYGFGSTPGYVVLTGLQIEADSWSDTEITFTVPDYGSSGFISSLIVGIITSGSIPTNANNSLRLGEEEARITSISQIFFNI